MSYRRPLLRIVVLFCLGITVGASIIRHRVGDNLLFWTLAGSAAVVYNDRWTSLARWRKIVFAIIGVIASTAVTVITAHDLIR